MTQPGVPGNNPPAGGAPAGGTGGAAPDAGGEWFAGAAPEYQAWAREQKLSSLDDALGGYRNMVKLKGAPANELVRLPSGWDEKPETAAEVYARLGRPETPDKYELPAIPVGEGGGYDLSSGFKGKAHELGLTARQAKGLAEWFSGEGKGYEERTAGEVAARIEAEDAALSTKWGPANTENRVLATRAANLLAQSVGVNAEKLDALFQSSFGYQPAMEMLALLGRSLGEMPAVMDDPSASGQFGQTAAAIGRSIADLEGKRNEMFRAGKSMNDPEYRALHNQITELYHKQTGESVPKGLVR